MKKNHNRKQLRVIRPNRPLYPNAADANYVNRRTLDMVTAVVSGMGMVTAMVTLITLA